MEWQVHKQPRWNQRSSFSFAPAPFVWATLSTRRSLLPRRFPHLFAVCVLLRFLCSSVIAGDSILSFFCGQWSRRRVAVVAADCATLSLLGRLQEPADHDGRRARRAQGTNPGAGVLPSFVLVTDFKSNYRCRVWRSRNKMHSHDRRRARGAAGGGVSRGGRSQNVYPSLSCAL